MTERATPTNKATQRARSEAVPLASNATPMNRPPALALLSAGNMALQRAARDRVCVPGDDPMAAEAPLLATPAPARAPIKIELDRAAPWKALVDANANLADVSLELYGADLSPMFETDEGFMSMAKAVGRLRITLFTELLKPSHASEVHALMEAELDKDVSFVESKLMESWVDDDDEAQVLGRVRWWASAKDVRDRNGVLYFDRFLGRLEAEHYYTDYLVTESSRKSFLSLLHEEIEDDIGELTGLIANHSERFGDYRPTTLLPTMAPTDDRSELLVQRTTDQLLDRMVGFTSGADEQGIVGSVTALPGPLQARVLQELATRHSERRLKVFSRTGEQDEEGMLHFLFEDLEDEDKRRMGDDLRNKGVLTAEAVETLIAGRSWAGRNLPWSTGHGKKAAMFWANQFNESDNKAYSAVSATMGGFASLWTPDTAGTTIMVLATANPSGLIGSTVARAPLIVQKGLLVAGTGLGAYQATTATIQAVSGKDADGRALSVGERLAKTLEAVSTTILLGVGFAGARSLTPRVPVATESSALVPLAESPTLATPAVASGEQRVAWRVMSETAEGEITAVGIHHESGDVAVLKVNKHTGDGSVFSPRLGRVNLVAGKPVAPALELGPGGTPGPEPFAAGADTGAVPGAINVAPGVDLLPAAPAMATTPPRGLPGPVTPAMGPGNTPLALPGTVAPTRLPASVPLQLAAPPALRMLPPPTAQPGALTLAAGKVASVQASLARQFPVLAKLDPGALTRVVRAGHALAEGGGLRLGKNWRGAARGQLLEELSAVRVRGLLADKAGRELLGLGHIEEEMIYIEGHRITDAGGAKLTDGIVAIVRGDKLEIVAVLESKAGQFAAEGFAEGIGGLSRASTAEVMDALIVANEGRASGSALSRIARLDPELHKIIVKTRGANLAKLETTYREVRPRLMKALETIGRDGLVEVRQLMSTTEGQVSRDIERLMTGAGREVALYVDGKAVTGMLPKRPGFLGAVPKDMVVDDIAKQLAQEGYAFRRLDMGNVDLDKIDLQKAAVGVVDGLGSDLRNAAAP